MGDGTYFDNAPQQSEFGKNQDGSAFNDLGEAATAARDNCVGFKQFLAATDFIEKAGTAAGGLFDGEVSFDELFDAVDSALTLAVNLIETGELIGAGMDMVTGDPSGLVGAAMSNMASVGMSFLLEYFQPIQDLVGILTGNPERIRVSKSMWLALADGIGPMGTELLAQGEKLGEVWHDDASDAAMLRLAEGNDILQVAAGLSVGVAGALEFCACVFDKVQAYLMNRISDLIGFLSELVVKFLMGPVKWAEILVDAIPMFARIVLELIQLAMHVARAFAALIALLIGADTAVDRMLPYIDRMGATA